MKGASGASADDRVVLGQDLRVAGLFFGPVPREIEEQARAFVDRLAHADFAGATATFNASMKAALPPDRLRESWKVLSWQSGDFAEVRKVELDRSTVLLTSRFGETDVVIKVVYDLRDEVAGLFFLPGAAPPSWKPPPYAKPEAFVERDVTVGSAPALPGVLALPKGAGPFPVVVLIHGSGPQDMDETIGPNKPFRDIAWGLAGRGVAVLRYVKRTQHSPMGVATIKEEVLDGAAAAIDLATHTPEIDPKRVVVVGHSQGGYLAPRIAAENPAVAGIVLLAGPSRPLQDSIVDQLVYLTKLHPASDGVQLVASARAFKAVVEDRTLAPEASVDVPFGEVQTGRYFLSLRGYQPTDAARKLTIPILVLQGQRDYQVTAPDFDGWKKALAGRHNVTLKQYPALNHLFMAGTGTPRPAEYEDPAHVDAAVIDDLAAFAGRVP